MPFTCDAESGRVQLRPAPSRSYVIVGRREEVPVTLCRPGDPGRCRTLMAHRFDVDCGGRRVPWIRIAAVMRGAKVSRSWVEGGRMGIELAGRTGPALSRSCLGEPQRLMGPGRHAGRSGECLPWQRQSHREAGLLPAGFAPVGELGARLILTGGIPSPVDSMAGAPVTLAALNPPSRAEPPPEATPMPAPTDEPAALDGWSTVVRVAGGNGLDSASAFTATGRAPDWLFWSVVFSALAGIGWAAVTFPINLRTAAQIIPSARLFRREGAQDLGSREPRPGSASFFSSPASAEPATDHALVNAAQSVASLLAQTRIAVSTLNGAPPLREVLDHELEIIRQRLAVASATAMQNGEAASKAAPIYRALVRDLDRIRRISDSAASSLVEGRQMAMPRTRSEAFDQLGVNPDVSDTILKKVVDALRMSWHPDLARSETDRLHREERTKQINVAWDLITGKRGHG